jgi:ketosteroid isomerase-like protein
MSDGEQRLAIARSYIGAVLANDVEASLAPLSDQVEYRVEGRNPFAGTFHGRAQVGEHVARLLRDATSDFQKIEDWLSSDQRVAVIVRHRIEYRGRGAVARRLMLFEFDVEDRIDTVTVFTDSQENFDAMIGSDPTPEEPSAPAPPPAPPTVSGAAPPPRQSDLG